MVSGAIAESNRHSLAFISWFDLAHHVPFGQKTIKDSYCGTFLRGSS
jgi:hypothetical protein